MICMICKEEFASNHTLGLHLRKHGISATEYKTKYNLHRRCGKCGKILISYSKKTGYCGACRDRTGSNNPFYGKTHSKETKDHLTETSCKSTTLLWQQTGYRDKVIANATGLKRSTQFKTEQSTRIAQWYKENPEQIDIRSKSMKQSWVDGKIEPNINSVNESKLERELRRLLKQSLTDRNIKKKTIRVDGHWFYPDIIIDEQIIIEFYGDFWHANPIKFKADDIIHHSLSARDIWERDERRVEFLKERGYTVFVIWETDFKRDKKQCIQFLTESIK